MEIRKYSGNDLPEMIRIWNEVVEEGIAFPEEELLVQLEHYNHYLSWAGYALAIAIVLFLAYQAIKKKPTPKV